jgi:hypothetical protein
LNHPFFKFTEAAITQFERVERTIPTQILEEIIRKPLVKTKDPKGATNAIMYYPRMHKSGRGIDENTLLPKEKKLLPN